MPEIIPVVTNRSLAATLREAAAAGSSLARQLLQAGERAVTAGSEAFRSAGLLPAATLSGGPVLHLSPATEQTVLTINLSEWIPREELAQHAAWAGETLQLLCNPVDAGKHYLAAVPRPPRGSVGARLRIELQTADGTTCSVRLSPRLSTARFAAETLPGVAELGYRVVLEKE